MPTKVTVVMYHYVRDLKHSRYPEIKGLDSGLFIEQIEYLKKQYNIIDIDTLISCYDSNEPLPPKALLLTFDDAYIDHFQTVFPILQNRKLKGAFYTPVKTILENRILDVNKIHFILAAVNDKGKIICDILNQLKKYREKFDLSSDEHYICKHSKPNRFDPSDVIFIKRMLQVELPEKIRNELSDFLFNKYVSSDEKAFSRELYMNTEQLKCIIDSGMHVGSHGNDHYWLSSLTKEQQNYEIDRSINFMQGIGVNMKRWTICYPYGDYNQDTLEVLSEKGCKLGFTTRTDIADIILDRRFELPRLDTNDLPKDRHGSPNEWYNKG
jgi:peptidoglycan/xylan/chitin deacetylase (PgdA/CDA1 family)